MNTKSRKSVELKKTALTAVMYQEDIISVYKNDDEICFEVGDFFTNDTLEFVAFLMRNPKYDKLKIWNCDYETKIVNPINIIYWLSGGDIFWKNPELNKEWSEIIPDILNRFENTVYGAFEITKISDIRKYFRNHLNFDSFYEFALSKDII